MIGTSSFQDSASRLGLVKVRVRVRFAFAVLVRVRVRLRRDRALEFTNSDAMIKDMYIFRRGRPGKLQAHDADFDPG